MSNKSITEQLAAISAEAIQTSVWRTAPVSDQPSLTLMRWRVIETQTGDRHFVGFNADDREGRVSTAIQEFDPSTGCGVTRSGRVYRLIGEPGYDSDGEWVWNFWKRANNVTTERDVSNEIMQSILAAFNGAEEGDKNT